MSVGGVFFLFPVFLVSASLSGALVPSAWNSSGHGEAAGLSFVSSNHSYWFGVGSNSGGFVLGRRQAHRIGRSARSVPAERWRVSGDWGCLATALTAFHSWVKLWSGRGGVVLFWGAGG